MLNVDFNFKGKFRQISQKLGGSQWHSVNSVLEKPHSETQRIFGLPYPTNADSGMNPTKTERSGTPDKSWANLSGPWYTKWWLKS